MVVEGKCIEIACLHQFENWPFIMCGFWNVFGQPVIKKSEAFQSVHHVGFILCYTILYNFFALVFYLIRVRKLIWEDITQGKQ